MQTVQWLLLAYTLSGALAVAQQPPAGGPAREFTNSVGMKFMLIEPGTFLMGSEVGREDEKPVHKVTLTEGFYLQATEVTQRQWRAVVGRNPSRFQGADLPVENVSWEDAQEFLKKLNGKEKGVRYRLPTEAEWEYAARAGRTGAPPNLDEVAWYEKNSKGRTHPVGQKRANGWGLYDTLGNVWEWCSDRYGSDYYAQSPSVDPPGPARGADQVLRGGSWGGEANYTREAYRSWNSPAFRSRFGGFRCVRELFP